MSAEANTFFDTVAHYTSLDTGARTEWSSILTERRISKGHFLLRQGDVARSVSFVDSGLLAQSFTDTNGDLVIKRFFPSGYFAASASSMLTGQRSQFSISACEDSCLIEYDFASFMKLVWRFPSIAKFYIRYMERHWIIEKEPLEISFRLDTAATRYSRFREEFPGLEDRLKQHEIASYLGITPTQLSRIRASPKRKSLDKCK